MTSCGVHTFTISGVNVPAVAVQGMPRGINELDRRQALKTIGVTTLGALSLGTGIAASHGNDTAHANSDLGDVRRATEQYHDVQVALDDGFHNTDQCVPQMGVHFVHPGRMQDAILDPERPEVQGGLVPRFVPGMLGVLVGVRFDGGVAFLQTLMVVSYGSTSICGQRMSCSAERMVQPGVPAGAS